MGWVTIYISGKPDFEQEVLHQLGKSGFAFLPGSSDHVDLALYWVNESFKLRDFKKAVGAKIVFKYRLRFYASVELFQQEQNKTKNAHQFTTHEKGMIHKMKAWEKTKKTYSQID
ncbi:MAG: hypothetical protein JJE09_07210 [Bacteroidia bacterium]|nr:hypothetical protein [Bacteroidia bacterium]